MSFPEMVSDRFCKNSLVFKTYCYQLCGWIVPNSPTGEEVRRGGPWVMWLLLHVGNIPGDNL